MKTIKMKSIPIVSINTSRSRLWTVLSVLFISLLLLNGRSFAQGVGISESTITPDASAILELRSASRGFMLPRLATGSISSPARGLLIYNGTTDGNFLSFYNGTWNTLATLASPTFTGTVTIPTPFTLGATSVTSTGTQLNYLSSATGTTGTTSTNLVFSTSPVLTTPDIGVATATSVNKVAISPPTTSATLTLADGSTLATSGANSITLTSTAATNVTLPTTGTLATTGVLIGITTLTTLSVSPYSPTAGTTKMLVYIVGGGGQGGGSIASNGNAGGGGGAGGVVIDVIAHSGATTYAFSVGAAGSGAAAGASGNPGGNTTFNGVTANGGAGGTVGLGTIGSVRAGGAGGAAAGGSINIPGMNGGHGVKIVNTTFFGLAGTGGSSVFGSGGAGRTGSSGVGNVATGYGAGGGGALGATSFAGGAGTDGVIIIYEYK